MENEYTYRGTHKRKVKAYHILSRIFLPLGIALTVIGIVLLAVSIPNFVGTLVFLDESGACVSSASGVRCSATAGETSSLVLSSLGLGLGLSAFLTGLPMFILSFIFRAAAKNNRAEDIAHGIDYTDFPYGK